MDCCFEDLGKNGTMKFEFRLMMTSRSVLRALVCASSFIIASSVQLLGFDHAVTSQKVVALTFDADMTPKMLNELKQGRVTSWYNQRVISTLRLEHVPATLFLAGLWIEAYPAITHELADDPLFELGSHSYSHAGFRLPCYGLAPVPGSNEVVEVQRAVELLKKYASTSTNYFRFPGLCSDADDVRTVEAQGYIVIGGDVDGGDAFEKNAGKIVSTTLAHVRPGSIVILHLHGGPNAPETANALPDIISKLRLRGYTFVKVSDLLSLSGTKN
jgi:peptidoglycan/xylan/chitin deacetylase (PgdA/CDA1 family)